MSFFTSLLFYRPTKPPIVTGSGLAEFIARMSRLGLWTGSGLIQLSLKFGKAIDHDEKPSHWVEYVGSIGTFKEIDWDLEESFDSVQEIVTALKTARQAIYRCHLMLGNASDEVSNNLSRVASPENKIDLSLDGWSLELGPITLGNLSDDQIFSAGWMGIGISGPGYLYPWSTSQLVDRAESLPVLQSLATLCRATWPVSPEKPNLRVRRIRAKYEGFWPYCDPAMPWDWYWGVNETG